MDLAADVGNAGKIDQAIVTATGRIVRGCSVIAGGRSARQDWICEMENYQELPVCAAAARFCPVWRRERLIFYQLMLGRANASSRTTYQ